jgi:capsule polysaccharide export protein KpsE/RkpR
MIVVILAAMVSAIASFLLKPKFKSLAVVYPVNLSPSSEESNTEQLLQYFNSEEVMEAVAQKFDLYTHYGIDTTEAEHNSLFKFMFNSNVKISPTLYESVEIEVKDESPKMAQNIAQGLIDQTNYLIFSVKRERLFEYINNTGLAISNEFNSIDSLNLKIRDIRVKYNIIDVQAQAKYLSKKLLADKTLVESDKALLEGLKTKSTEMEKLWNLMSGRMKTINEFIEQKDKYLFDYNSRISFTNIVTKPSFPDKKCFPVRWIIVTVSTLSAFVMACLFFILTYKSIRKVD